MSLNADNFQFSEDIYLGEFERVVRFVIYSYEEILKKEKFIEKEWETFLRNVLVRYLRDEKDKHSLAHLFFEIETGEIQEDGREVKFLDIKISNLLNNEIANESEYYSFECKRLDGTGTKNKAYLDEGIKRFTQAKYAKQMPLAGMIGFVESGDINAIVKDINARLGKHSEIRSIKLLKQVEMEKRFKHAYCSEHARKRSLPNIKLTHLMFDYTPIIIQKA